MKRKHGLRKFLSLTMCWLMLFTSLPFSGVTSNEPSFAAAVGAGPSADGKSTIQITNIKFVRNHNGFNTSSAYIMIQGSGLKGSSILMDTLPAPPKPGGPEAIGTKDIDSDGLLTYTYTAAESMRLTGTVFIGNKSINLDFGTFPTINSLNTKNIYHQSGTPQTLVMNGNNLDQIKTGALAAGVDATFGRNIVKPFYYNSGTGDTAQKITLTNPTPPEASGFQNIRLAKTGTYTDPAVPANSCSTSIEYQYGNSFRFLNDVGLVNLKMFPNMGANEDQVFFDADTISPNEYAVYFLTALDGSDDFTDAKKAEFVSIVTKTTPLGQDRLIVKVPKNLPPRNYNVVITNTQNGEVVASQTVMKADNVTPDIFTIVMSSYKPVITAVRDVKGPDTGGPVELSGKNILTATLPSLDEPLVPGTDTYSLSGANKSLHIDYAAGYKFGGSAASVARDVSVQIGKMVFFQVLADGTTPILEKGVTDKLELTTDRIDDADTSPVKDVVVDVATTITITAGVDTGKVYVFHQVASLANGFTFIPSTLTPTITKVSPPIVNVESVNGDFKPRSQTYLSIEGSNFMVEQYVDGNGVVRTRYPSVLVKKTSDNTRMNDYQIAFLPNEIDPGTNKGVVKYMKNGVETLLKDSGGVPLAADVTVLNNAGVVVTGIEGNQIGTRILIRIPADTKIEDLGSKHIQVTNPRRGSTNYGGAAIKVNSLDFINVDDAPAISSVDPTILTVEGGQDVKITGKNFQVGLKLYLDGKEITSFDRKTAPGASGEVTLSFKSPASRECVTQILLLNPSGGTAVRPVTYVKALQNAPSIASFTPLKGTPGTLVVVNGDNFQQPDPTVASATGLDGNRLIGSRVFFDGKDVNNYNLDGNGEILFIPYVKPAEDAFIQTTAGKAGYSNYKDNTVVTRVSDGKIMKMSYDNVGNPMLSDGSGGDVVIRASGSGYVAVDGNGASLGTATLSASVGGVATLTVGTQTFNIVMNNKILFAGNSDDGVQIAKTANYSESVVLSDGKGYSTLTTDLKGNVILSNGKDNIFTITYTGGHFEAKKAGGTVQTLTVDDDKLVLGGTVNYTFLTPYEVASNGHIIGNRTRVITKNQISFTIPKDRGYSKGYKDIKVANPDTKYDSKTGKDGFYLIPQASTNPVIASIVPDKGSVDGGYNIVINGSDFADSAKVYIDSVLVPSTDTHVAIDGKSITLKVPKCSKDLVKDFDVDHFAVPIVIVNDDGGTAFREKGFTYLIPISSPVISKVIPLTGSANGGQIVEIMGSEFRFFEPYQDTMLQGGFVQGDKWTDLFGNGKWDDLMKSTIPNGDLGSPVTKVTDSAITGYGYYYTSPILPKIYFGEKEAKIVEFSNGYLKVITPPHVKGAVDLFVVNNDYGVSNKLTYTYTASSPKITSMIPNKGRRTGQEMKDVYGSEFYATTIKGYYNDVDSAIVEIPDVKTLIRFANIDNLDVSRDSPNGGMINNQHAIVSLTGGLRVEYKTDSSGTPQLVMTVEEGGKVYTRTFSNYDGSATYLPMEMLKNGANYYVPFNYTEADGLTYKNNVYEYIRVSVEDRALKVERGYAPKTIFDNKGHVQVMTPSYYTIDTVNMTLTNDDGGKTTTPFTYTNPASIPKIYQVQPFTLSSDGSYLMVEGALNGNIEIEILGKDLRKGATVAIGGKQCTVVETTTKTVNGVVYDMIIAKIPTGAAADIDLKYPIVIENTDGGLANSSTINNLIGPNYNTLTLPTYFQYRKPLSGPKIASITPSATSINGGNTITITGSDFRAGAYVIIGSRGGVPVKDVEITNNGTVLTFKTPTTLTLGDKDVQVINSDFGIDTKANSLKVVSYPQTNGTMYDENHHNITRLSTEGGQTITILGTGFAPGAQVIFGGTSTATADPIGGNVGLWKTDAHYLLKGGAAGTNVKVLDSTALTVTTPVMKTEGPVTITVINADSGISDGNLITEYRLPIPSDVTTLSVKVIDKKYIQLYNYTSTNLDYYEIYYYIGQYTEQTLKGADNYQDFKLLEVTDREPYKILDLPGYESKKTKDYVWFVVKAVNKYGASNYSNLAYLTDTDVKDLAQVGAPDLDGPSGVPTGKDYLAYVKDNTLTSDLSNAMGNVSMTLTSFGGGKYPTRQINLPASRVLGDYGSVQVDYGDLLIKVAPVTLNTSEFSMVSMGDKSYGQITISNPNNSYSSSLKQTVPRNQRMVSPLYQLSFAAVNNKGKTDITQLKGQMLLRFDYGRYALTPAEEARLAIYKFNTVSNEWQKQKATVNKALDQIAIQVKEPGTYMILTNK